MLNLGRLRMLYQLSVLGTISAVAANLKVTRPAVSQQLGRLEEEIGTVLFERSGRSLQLTPAGRRLVAHASVLFRMVEQVEAELAASSRTVSGVVRVAGFGSTAMSLVPDLYSGLSRTHSQLDLLFTEMKAADALHAAAARQVDLAIVDDQVSVDPVMGALEFHPLCVDHYRAVLPANHPLAGKRSIQLSEMAHERWATGQDGTAHYRFVMNACYASGFTPHVVSKCMNMAARLELVKTGTAVTILPWLALRVLALVSDFRLIPVLPKLTRQIFAVLPQGSSRRPAIEAVLQLLQRIAREMEMDVGSAPKRHGVAPPQPRHKGNLRGR